MEFLIAVLLGAFLLGDRIAPPPELRRRLYQVSLGLMIVLFVMGLNPLIFPIPDVEDIFETAFSNREATNTAAEVAVAENLRERAIFLGFAGVGLIIAGFLKAPQFPTSYLAPVLAGILLLVFSFADEFATTSSIYSLAFEYIGSEAGPERNGLYLAVFGVGAFVLFLHGFNQWDRSPAAYAAVDIPRD